ncbi:MAG: hypothetical protein KF703_10950 [Actinobacteria bacterium]|nr:hypothetical protein [Actinomycetota bacterium]
MANKRDTAQQKRARQNRAQREALAARTQGAPKRPSRVAPSTAEKLAAKSAGGSSSSSKGTDGDKKGGDAKPRKVRPPRPGDVPVDVDALEGSWRQKIAHVPGGTQILMAAILTVCVVVYVSYFDTFVSEAAQAASKRPRADQTIYEALGVGPAVALLGVTVAAVGASLAVALKPARRRVWWIATGVVLFIALFGQVAFLIVVAGMLGFGAYKSYKVESGGASLFRRRSASDRDGTLDESTPVEDGGPA